MKLKKKKTKKVKHCILNQVSESWNVYVHVYRHDCIRCYVTMIGQITKGFCNIIFQIRHKFYVAPGSSPTPPHPHAQ